MKFSIQSLYTWYGNLLRNPKYRWWVVLGTLVYLVSPFDFLPDVFPIIGQVDDVFLLTLLVSEVSGLVIEGWKARKGDVGTETEAANTTETSTTTASTTASTIDVDAVSVK